MERTRRQRQNETDDVCIIEVANMVNDLPNPLLLRIISYLNCADLLSAEQVCRTWQMLIRLHIWPRVTVINEETLDYPCGDYLRNFVALAVRVRRVTDFINIFRLVDPTQATSDKVWMKLKRASSILACRSTVDTIFPLDLVKNATFMQSKWKGQRPVFAAKNCDFTVKAVSIEMMSLRVEHYKAIRFDYMFVHEPKVGLDAFYVARKGAIQPITMHLPCVTRIVIHCLVVNTFWCGEETSQQAAKELQKLEQCPNLELVDIETFQLRLLPRSNCMYANLTLIFRMHPHQCLISATDFKAFLTKMADRDPGQREADVLHCVNKWFKAKAVRTCELRVHDDKMEILKSVSTMDRRCRTTPQKELIRHVFPKHMDSLHLELDRLCGDVEPVLDEFRSCFKLLTKLTVSFALGGKKNRIWDEYRGACKAFDVLNFIKNTDLKKLESLTLDFLVGGPLCPSIPYEPMRMTRMLPCLTKLECLGLPCFPFLTLLIAKAPKLRRLVITSQPFCDDQQGFEAMAELVASLKGSKSLAFVDIHVNSEQEPTGSPGPPLNSKPRNRQGQAHVLSDLTVEIKKLMDTLPRMMRISVSVHYYQYSIVLDKRS